MNNVFRRFYIRLPDAEFELLRILAQREMRDTRAHLRWLILQEATRHGLLDTRQEEGDGERKPKAA